MSSEHGSNRPGGAQESAQRLGEALEDVAKAWSGKAKATVPDQNPPGPSPDPLKLARAASKLSDSTLLNKLVGFASGLDERELEDLKVLLIPAVLVADAAAGKAINPKHGSPAEFLRELDVRLSRGDITVGPGVAATPTITTVTITTTVASHPIIGCSKLTA